MFDDDLFGPLLQSIFGKKIGLDRPINGTKEPSDRVFLSGQVGVICPPLGGFLLVLC